LDLLKKIQGLSCDFGIFWISQNCFCVGSHGSGLWITGQRLALNPWWTCDHGAARPLWGLGGRRDSSKRERERERERRSSGLSPMMPLGDRATEMSTRRRSTEATGGSPMGRWFRTRGGEIGARVGVVDNGVLSLHLL
jgi:hypothetical protein